MMWCDQDEMFHFITISYSIIELKARWRTAIRILLDCKPCTLSSEIWWIG